MAEHRLDLPSFLRVALALAAARTIDDVIAAVANEVTDGVGARARLVGEAFGPATIDESDESGDVGPVHRVPLSPTNRDLGVLEYRFPRAVELTAGLSDDLAQIAKLVAHALQRAIETDLDQSALARLRQLEQMSGVRLLQMGLEELTAELPKRIAEVLGCQMSRIFLVDDTGELLVEAGSYGLDSSSPPRRLHEGLTGRVITSGGGQIFEDIALLDVVGTLPSSVDTVAAVPLFSGDQVVGVLDVGASKGRSFDDDDLTVLELAADRIAVALDRSQAFQREQDHRKRSEFLADLGRTLESFTSPRVMSGRVAALLTQWLSDGCAVSISTSEGEPIRATARRIAQAGPVVTIEGTDGHDPDRWASVPPSHSATLTLRGLTVEVGSLTVNRFPERAAFTPSETALLGEAASRIGAAIEFRMLFDRQRSITLELQRSLLPSSLPPIPGADLAVSSWAPSNVYDVGGDFFDVFQLDDDRWGILIGDVSGKGVRAAAMTGIARHTARAACRHGLSPPEVLTWIHDAFISERETSETYCTAMFGILQRSSQNLEITFSIGGHPRPIVIRRDEGAEFVGPGGTVLGLVEKVRFREATVELRPDDVLVMYTDGVTDVPGDAALTDEGLLGLVEDLWSRTGAAADLTRALESTLSNRYRDVTQDDTVVMALHNSVTFPEVAHSSDHEPGSVLQLER